MKQLNIRVTDDMKNDLDLFCEKNNILISEYVISLLADDLNRRNRNAGYNSGLISAKIELEEIVELVEGVHQAQLDIVQLLNKRNGDTDD